MEELKKYWETSPQQQKNLLRKMPDKSEEGAKILLDDLMKFYGVRLKEPNYTRLLTGLALFLESLGETYTTPFELLQFIKAFGEGLDSDF